MNEQKQIYTDLLVNSNLEQSSVPKVVNNNEESDFFCFIRKVLLSYFGHTFKWPVDSTVETSHENSTYYSSDPNGVLRGIIKL